MRFIQMLTVVIGLALLLAGCGARDFSEERSRSDTQFQELQVRLERVQAAR